MANSVLFNKAIPKDKRKGDWLTGYHRHAFDYYIFCNVGTAGRTGHDYDNHWEDERLVWYGKTYSHFRQGAIRNMISDLYRVLVFYRNADRAPFIFAGIGTPIPHYDIVRPVRIDWVFGSETSATTPVFTDEFSHKKTFTEGTRIEVYVNRFERNRVAREACIHFHGNSCAVCGFDFQDVYGEIGRGFIHVHHVTPISEIGSDYQVDPKNDLVPVCPNCHAMLHRRNPPMTVNELKSKLQT